jgi:hypothetical protein
MANEQFISLDPRYLWMFLHPWHRVPEQDSAFKTWMDLSRKMSGSQNPPFYWRSNSLRVSSSTWCRFGTRIESGRYYIASFAVEIWRYGDVGIAIGEYSKLGETEHWYYDIVPEYSRCELSQKSDRLPAISGIAK